MLSTFNEKQMILENKIYIDIFFYVVYVEITKQPTFPYSKENRKDDTATQGLYREDVLELKREIVAKSCCVFCMSNSIYPGVF